MRQGWVYVMVNASMKNMVKVGRTTREPRLRVAELSSATGVPTPFMLKFGQIYTDCERAEREIHDALDERGLRVSVNREFFHGPARNIVRIIMAHAGQEPGLPWLLAQRAAAASQASAEFLPRLARRKQLEAAARAGDRFCYAELAALAAADGDGCECLRAWDLFFATNPGIWAEAGIWADPRTIPACRRYITCCLMLGQVPMHRSILLHAADDMLDQQLADLQRLRGTAAAPRLAAVMRWIYDNLAPGCPGDGGLSGADAAARTGAKPSRIAAA